MKKYQRVCIIGNGGSGKSTLAVALGNILGLPVLHLDKVCWKSGWVKVPDAEVIAAMNEMADGDVWIIDGNYKKTLEYRLSRADLVIYLDYNPIFCLYRALKRALMTTVRPDMAEGCVERFNLPFYKYVLGFNKKSHPRILKLIETYKKQFDFYQIKNFRELKTVLSKLKCNL